MVATGIELKGAMAPSFARVLTPDALQFVASLTRGFRMRREELLARRGRIQAGIDGGRLPDFLPETREVRESSWKVAPPRPDLEDRRVEITGPADRKMMINAFNSGAKVFMADFEDSHSPTWEGTLQGQVNLRDAVERTLEYISPEGKEYRLSHEIATLMVRPRGWHLDERHLLVDGRAVPAALFDFGLFFFHNARRLAKNGSGPYFYLPKLENHLEARLWNDVFLFAQEAVGLPRGTTRATVLIETILAVFEMHEILWELREHSAGLNCGRWDFIFSYIKKLGNHADRILPDRAQVTMTVPFLKNYVDLLIQTCHARGAHAMGGMAAQIPNKADPARNEEAMRKVRVDKLREVRAGHDGTWVAHPGLVPVAMEAFAKMKGKNQLGTLRDEVRVTAADLLSPSTGAITEAGVRTNIRVGIQYLASWLEGTGCVALYGLMEDAATAEICRAQLWQWLRHGARLDDERALDARLYRSLADDELAKVAASRSPAGRLHDARRLFDSMVLSPEFEEFLTVPAYAMLVSEE
jgi:malate synthase